MAAAPHLTTAAEACLGVDAAVPAKITFLRRLDEVACLPSQEQVEAAGLLGLVARDGDEFPALEARVERQFLARLDDFLGRYWDLAPTDRDAEWQSLSALGGHIPKYEFRLRELQTGLTLTLPAAADGQMDSVVRGLEVAFLQPAAQRGRTLADIRQRAGLQVAELRMLAEAFVRNYPEFEHALLVLGLRQDLRPPTALKDQRRFIENKTAPGGSRAKNRMTTIAVLFFVCFLAGIRAGCGSPPTSNMLPNSFPTPAARVKGLPNISGVDHESLAKIYANGRVIKMTEEQRLQFAMARLQPKDIQMVDVALSFVPVPFHHAIRLEWLVPAARQ